MWKQINQICRESFLRLSTLFSYLWKSAAAAAPLAGVWGLNLHTLLYCLKKSGRGGGGSRAEVSCWSAALNVEWHLRLDAGANIGFGPGHPPEGGGVNGPLCQAHRAARPRSAQPAVSALRSSRERLQTEAVGWERGAYALKCDSTPSAILLEPKPGDPGKTLLSTRVWAGRWPHVGLRKR